MSDRPIKNNDQQPPNPPRTPLSRMPKGMLGWMMFFGMAMMLFLLLSQSMQHPNKVDIQQLKTWISQNRVSKITISGNTIMGELTPDKGQTKGGQFQVEVLPGLLGDTQFYQMVGLVNEQGDWTVPTTFDTNRSVFTDILLSMLPWLLIFGFLWFFLFRQLRMAGGGAGMLGNFGRSRHRVTTKEHTNVTFDDVAGIEEAKEEVSEIVEFLKNPRKFQRLGGGFRAACCWWASRAAARRCWPRRSPARRTCRSSPSAGRISWRCSWAWAPAGCATCSARPRRTRRASSSWMKSTRWAGGAGMGLEWGGTTSASRRSTRSWWRWTGSTPTTR